jgi:uncharacterized protein
LFACGLAALLWVLPGVALEVPPLEGRVNDHAGMLPPAMQTALEGELEAIERASGAQVAVLTVPSLEGENLEDFSLRVAEAWQLGQAGVDNGVLLFIARDDRKMRIEVGYGLEPTLTDALSRRILDEVIRPRFQGGDFPGGIAAGVKAIGAVVGGEGESALPAPSRRSDQRGDLPVLLFFLFFAADITRSVLARKGFLGWLVLFLFVGSLGYVAFQIFGALGALLIVGGSLLALIPLRAFLVRTVGPTLGSWGSQRSSGCAGMFWGPPPIIGRGGGSSGGSSGGGFSGGGGSFGGGGASSGW